MKTIVCIVVTLLAITATAEAGIVTKLIASVTKLSVNIAIAGGNFTEETFKVADGILKNAIKTLNTTTLSTKELLFVPILYEVTKGLEDFFANVEDSGSGMLNSVESSVKELVKVLDEIIYSVTEQRKQRDPQD